MHRANFSGNEFEAIDRSQDGRWLYVGTEKGLLLVWNVATRSVEKQLDQGQPIHAVVALDDNRTVITTGSRHDDAPINGTVRKWDTVTGDFVELRGFGDKFFLTALVADPSSGLVAASSVEGRIVVWNGENGQMVCQFEAGLIPLALEFVNRDLYYAGATREELKRDPNSVSSQLKKVDVDHPNASAEVSRFTNKIVTAIKASPDKARILLETANQSEITLFDVKQQQPVAKLEGGSALWKSANQIVVFAGLDPTRTVEIDGTGRTRLLADFKKIGSSLPNGRAFGFAGAVLSEDGKKAWGIFSKGGWLIEWDLVQQTGALLIQSQSGGYGLDVRPAAGESGLVLTGGDDGFLRLWDLPTLTLKKELAIESGNGYIDRAIFTADNQSCIVTTGQRSGSPTGAQPISVGNRRILRVNLDSGKIQLLKTLTEPSPDIAWAGAGYLYTTSKTVILADPNDGSTIRSFALDEALNGFALSSNARWLVVRGESGKLHLFEVDSGRLLASHPTSPPVMPVPFAVSNDGESVYLLRGNNLQTWKTRSNLLLTIEISGVYPHHTLHETLALTEDGSRLYFSSHDADVGVIEVKTGQMVFYEEMRDDGAFTLPNVWLNHDQLIFTTDTGVLVSGQLIPADQTQTRRDGP